MVNNYLSLATKMIKDHEGFRSKVYKDSEGFLTIGYGRNLESKGVSLSEACVLLGDDINDTVTWLSSYTFWKGLSDNRKAALIDMGFNLGREGFDQFVNFIAALTKGDYIEAAKQMRQSKWYDQVRSRAEQDALLILNG